MYEKPGLYKHWDFTLLDMLVLEACYFLAYYIRHRRTLPFSGSSSYTVMVLLIIILSLVSGIGFHNYKQILQRGYFKEFTAVVQHTVIVTAGLVLYLFITKDSSEISRLVVGYFSLLSLLFLYLERILYKGFLRRRNTRGYSRRNAILITDLGISKDRIEKLRVDLSGIVDLEGLAIADDDRRQLYEKRQEDISYCGLKEICSLEDLPDTIRNRWVDEAFILMTDREDAASSGILHELSTMGITLHFVLNTEDPYHTDKVVEKMGDTILLTESIRSITFAQAMTKRVMDIIGSLVGLAITGILTIIIGPMIYVADPGPIFYKQKRIGRNGRIFNMYKFRSMYRDADARKKELMQKNEMSGLMFKMKDDPRILGSGPDGTKHGIGWFIRTTSIDEFPQFLNVLLGQLSLVGTRPPTVDEWNKYESHHRARMAVKPGITGLWQVSGRSNVTDFEDVVKLDLEYISNFSIAEDIRIIFKTIKVVMKHEGAE